MIFLIKLPPVALRAIWRQSDFSLPMRKLRQIIWQRKEK